MNREKNNTFFSLLCLASAIVCSLVILFLFGVIFWNGIKAISPDFLFTESWNFGAGGGIFYQILGSLLLIVCAAAITVPLALGTALFKSEYMKNRVMLKLFSLLIYGLNGVPSIIFGLFGLIFFMNILGTGLSWFVGSLILSFMILPTVVLATYQSINSIPKIYRENGYALGLTKGQVITRVILPQGISGVISGLLIGLARAVGETAPVMFIATAFSGVTIPGSLFEPVTALPTHILALSQQATNEKALQNAWGATLVLVSLVILFTLSALFSRMKFKTVTKR